MHPASKRQRARILIVKKKYTCKTYTGCPKSIVCTFGWLFFAFGFPISWFWTSLYFVHAAETRRGRERYNCVVNLSRASQPSLSGIYSFIATLLLKFATGTYDKTYD